MSATPSSATEGFFQALPILTPQYTDPALLSGRASTSASNAIHASDDVALARVLELYLPRPTPPEVTRPVHDLSRRVLQPDTLRLGVDAETNPPTLHPLTTFGQENREDPLRTSEGWKELKKMGIAEGAVAHGYSRAPWNRRAHQYGIIHVWSSAASLTMCPASMTDGAAKLLSRHLDDADHDGGWPGRSTVFREAYRRLTSFDPAHAWTSGQWMTERSGGSDVSRTETVARRLTEQELHSDRLAGRDRDAHDLPLGPWRVDGFKWFSSATDSDMAVLLARTSRGLSAFMAPMRRRSGRAANQAEARIGSTTELNGVRIQRLKSKLGTKQLPTAELELRGMRAWLVGEEGRGVKEVSAILNITRLHTAAGSVAGWGRGLAVSRAYTKVRTVKGGQPLSDNRQHLRWMAGETVKYWAGVHLSFLGVALLGASEQGWVAVVQDTWAEKLIPRDPATTETLLRLLTPVMKAKVSLRSADGLRACMESLGGVGYCENNEDGGVLNLAKVFRDTVVNTIWEGTVSVMAEDVVRVLSDQRLAGGKVLQHLLVPWMETILSSCASRFPDETDAVRRRLTGLAGMTQGADVEELLCRGRDILDHLEATVCASLLIYDASLDEDDVACEIARRWVWSVVAPAEGSATATRHRIQQLELDRTIFLGGGRGRGRAHPRL